MKKKIALVALLGLMLIPVTAQLKVGDVAPDFKLKNIDGTWVQLSDYNNQKGVVVIFTCNHCPYAKMYESRIQEIHARYQSQKVPVVAINSNDSTIVQEDSYSNMIKNAKKKGFTFPYLLDDQQLFRKYGATRTPHVFLLKKDKKQFVVSYIGAIDDYPQNAKEVKETYLADAIEAVLQGKAPKVTLTKSVGCSIKFK
ncbi:thioredoxin family protein [Geofilum sp. OHC36d9]|uniref:thioredoxin family protein n=1 Tax=Geofilum sp. OHC36d9 TaxID=3458413 RepID=UPI0040339F76